LSGPDAAVERGILLSHLTGIVGGVLLHEIDRDLTAMFWG
jgi:hypothetical protein